MSNKRGQVTLFVIVAVLIVALTGLVAYFSGVGPFGLPPKLTPVENQIIDCIEESTLEGLAALGEQGGYIESPDFEAGSDFAPSTSQINFFGSLMPYWLYLSANGEYKEQVPTIKSIESQLGVFIGENVEACDVDELLEEGYDISFEEPSNVDVDVRAGEVFVDLDWPVTISFEGTSRRVSSHTTKVQSNFGKLYNLARKIHETEKSRLFLEQYTLDILALYVPGTNVEFTCSPKVWFREEVEGDLLDALQSNIATLKISGDYYKLSEDERRYFVTGLDDDLKDEQVNFFYDKTFPTKIEVVPSDGDVLRADPIGNQEGLGLLGFCYVPYHFVYTVQYPVIVQIFDEEFGLFQFPIIVSVENNQPREAVKQEALWEEELELCEYKVQDFSVRTIDTKGNPVESSIGFKCSNTFCPIGQTEGGRFEGMFPQCVNGFIVAQKAGFIDSSAQVSTNQFGSAEIIMKPKHEVDVRVLKDLELLGEDESAFISFISDEWSAAVLFPTQDKVELAEGTYTVSSYLFKEGRIVLDAQSTEKCVDVPRSGVLGLFGFEKEECYTIDQPAQELDQITIGGGSAEVFISDEDLNGAEFVGVEIGSQPTPETVLELQDVYTNIASSGIGLTIR